MKDYSALSDFEINKQIAESLGNDYVSLPAGCLSGSAVSFISHRSSGLNREGCRVVSTFDITKDFCNYPSDAWPIILQHKINIDHRESIKAGAMAKLSGNNEIYAVHTNPLRAAMEVYLMAEDAGLLKD